MVTRTVTMHGGPWDGLEMQVADNVRNAVTFLDDGWTQVLYEPRERGSLDWYVRPAPRL